MSTVIPSPTVLARLGALLVGAVPLLVVGVPAAQATDATVRLTLAAGQSGSIGQVVSNTSVTPVSSCDSGLSVSFDPELNGTVTVGPTTADGAYACAVDFQISGQSTGLVEHVLVTVAPGLSINDVSVQESSPPSLPHTVGGVGADINLDPVVVNVATFTVTLSEPPTSTVTVQAATADGTASAASDYTAANTTVTFQPGQTVQIVGVPITPDSTVEPNETFTLTLSAPSGAAIVDGQGTGTIVNDDFDPDV